MEDLELKARTEYDIKLWNGGIQKRIIRKIEFSKQHLLIATEFIPFGATPRRFCLGLLKVLCGDLLNKNYTGITETVSHWYAESALLWDIRRRYYTEIARKRAKFKGAIMPERSFLMSNYYFNLLSNNHIYKES